MGIGDGGLFNILVHGGSTFLVAAFNLKGHLRAVVIVPVDLLVYKNPWFVLLGIDLDFNIVRRGLCAGAGNNLNGFARGELTVHPGGGDADALLPSAHAQSMKIRSVQELRKNPGNLLANDAGAIIDHRDSEAAGLARWGRGLAVGDDFEFNDDLRKDPGFLTGVKRVVDGFFDAGEQRLAWIVKTQEVPVLRKEL